MTPLKIPYNIIANYLGRGYSIIAIYLFVPFYISILGVEAYGVIAIYAVLLTIAGLANIGLLPTFSREAARTSDKKRLMELLSTFERTLSLFSGAFAILVIVGAKYIAVHWFDTKSAQETETMVTSLRLMALMIVPQILTTLYTAGLLGLQRQVTANIWQSLFVTARSGMVILPILWRPQLSVFFIWQAFATVIFAICMRAVLLRAMGYSNFPAGRFNRVLLKENISFASGMLWISLISAMNTQIDKLVVSKLFSLSEFGYYTLAAALAQIPVALATPIAVAFYPLVTSHVGKGDKVGELQTYEIYGRWIVFAGALGSFGILFFSHEILSVWLLDTKIPPMVAQISSTLAIGSLFLCLTMPPYYLILAHGKSGVIARSITATLLLSLPCMFIFTKIYGILGVAIPWIILNFTNAIVMILITRRYLGEHFKKIAINVIFSAIVLPLAFIACARIVVSIFEMTNIVSLIVAGTASVLASILFFLLSPSNNLNVQINK